MTMSIMIAEVGDHYVSDTENVLEFLCSQGTTMSMMMWSGVTFRMILGSGVTICIMNTKY